MSIQLTFDAVAESTLVVACTLQSSTGRVVGAWRLADTRIAVALASKETHTLARLPIRATVGVVEADRARDALLVLSHLHHRDRIIGGNRVRLDHRGSSTRIEGEEKGDHSHEHHREGSLLWNEHRRRWDLQSFKFAWEKDRCQRVQWRSD